MARQLKLKWKKIFLYQNEGIVGKLLDSTECQILLDTGVSKSFMSKSHYLKCISLHSLPNLHQRVQVVNDQYDSVVFIIPIVIDIHAHRFEIFTLVLQDTWKCRLSLRHKEHIWTRGYY